MQALARSNFGGDYSADNVAHFLRSVEPGIDEILSRSETLCEAGVETCGFEVYVDAKEALSWLLAVGTDECDKKFAALCE